MRKIVLLLVCLICFVLWVSVFEVSEGEVAVVKRGGNPVREHHEAGIHYKWPIIETVVFVDKRLQIADFVPQNMPTSDNKNFTADMFALWRVDNAKQYVQALGGSKDVAESRLSRVVFSHAGSRLTQNPLEETLTTERDSLMKEAVKASNHEAAQFGTEVALIRLNKVDLPESSRSSTYDRMKANLDAIRIGVLSSADAEAAKKIAVANKTATETISGAYLRAQQLSAEGIAEAGKIRKEAYSADMQFYSWYRSWLTKQRVWQSAKPEVIYQNGDQEYNKFYNK